MQEKYYMNDTYILHMGDLTWCRVYENGADSIPRAAHSAIAYDSKILIFGGINKTGYIGSSLSCLELDPTLVKKLKND